MLYILVSKLVAVLLTFYKQQTQLELLLCRAVVEEHQRKRAAGSFNPFRPYLMAERMLNFESLLLDVVEAVQSGKRADGLDAPAMRRMQLAQQQQLVQDQEAQHGELERVLEIADRERADRGAQGAEDEETDAGSNLPQDKSNWLLCCSRHFCNTVILAQTAKLLIITSALVSVTKLYSDISALIPATCGSTKCAWISVAKSCLVHSIDIAMQSICLLACGPRIG